MDQKIVDQVMAKIRPALEQALEEVMSLKEKVSVPGTASLDPKAPEKSPLVTEVKPKAVPAEPVQEVPPLGGLAAEPVPAEPVKEVPPLGGVTTSEPQVKPDSS